jgi:hypothetical protein
MNDTTATVDAATADTLVAMSNEKFHFKTEKLRNEKGEVIGNGKKHPSVEIPLPVPTMSLLAMFVSDPAKYAKECELLRATVLDQIYRVARGQINDFREKNPEATVTAASLNYDKLGWTAIANMPKSERSSSVPSDEDIKEFLDSYLNVMPAALDKPKKNIENHVACFQAGFKKQRSQKDILEMFTNALAVYVTAAGDSALEEHMEVIEYFQNKLGKLLKTEEKITMDDL